MGGEILAPGGMEGGLADLGPGRDGSMPSLVTGGGGGGMTTGLSLFSFSRSISSLDRTKALKGGGAGGVGGVGGFNAGSSGFVSTAGGSSPSGFSAGANSSTSASAEIGSMLLEAVDTWYPRSFRMAISSLLGTPVCLEIT